MPPLPSRPSISGLQAALSCSLRTATTTAAIPASSTWATRRQTPLPSSASDVRSASTSAGAAPAAKAASFPPESPNYIHIPELPQSSEERPARPKGHLPVPRKIFPKRDGDRKILPSHLEQTVPVSAAEQAGLPPKSENEARRRLNAASRREALQQGLQGLWERSQQREKRKEWRNLSKRARHRAVAMAPEPTDEVLTRSTVLASTALNTAVLPDPERFEKAEKAAKQHAEKMALKALRRRDALQRLYVAAADFIVNEKELEARVEDIFDDKFFERSRLEPAESIWETSKVPVTVAETMGSVFNITARTQETLPSAKSDWLETTERQKELAEELTGGTM